MRFCQRNLLACLFGLLCCGQPTSAESRDSLEYAVKAAFLYNFASFTEWPAGVGNTLNLCVVGSDPFGAELDRLAGRSVAGRSLAVHRIGSGESLASLANCQIVFVAQPAIVNLSRLLEQIRGKPVLTVADTPGAARQGVILNMLTEQNRVQFEANLGAAHANGLTLSSKLLRLARETMQ